MKKGVLVFWVVIIALIVIGTGAALFTGSTPGRYDALAQCLTGKGVKFYGAFWCSHCQATKALFGKSAKLLPYVECSTPDGQGQLQTCKDAEITGYPTWVHPDGRRLSGERSAEELAEFAACPLTE